MHGSRTSSMDLFLFCFLTCKGLKKCNKGSLLKCLKSYCLDPFPCLHWDFYYLLFFLQRKDILVLFCNGSIKKTLLHIVFCFAHIITIVSRGFIYSSPTCVFHYIAILGVWMHKAKSWHIQISSTKLSLLFVFFHYPHPYALFQNYILYTMNKNDNSVPVALLNLGLCFLAYP